MKEEIKTTTIEHKYYVCEGCGTRFGDEYACKQHEEEECAKSEKARAYCESQIGKCEYYVRGRFTAMAGELVGSELGLCKVAGYEAVDLNGVKNGEQTHFNFILETTHFEIHEPNIYDSGYPPVTYSFKAERRVKPYPPWGDFNVYGMIGSRISLEDYEWAVREIRKLIAAPSTAAQYDMYKTFLADLESRKIEAKQEEEE